MAEGKGSAGLQLHETGSKSGLIVHIPFSIGPFGELIMQEIVQPPKIDQTCHISRPEWIILELNETECDKYILCFPFWYRWGPEWKGI